MHGDIPGIGLSVEGESESGEKADISHAIGDVITMGGTMLKALNITS